MKKKLLKIFNDESLDDYGKECLNYFYFITYLT